MRDPKESIMAIDPGISGAIAIFTPCINRVRIYDLPQCQVLVKGKHKTTLDAVAMLDLFNRLYWQYSIKHIGIEQVSASPQMGVTSAFTFGRVFGMLDAMARAFPGATVHQIQPNLWKARYQLTGKDKKAAVKVALKYFPDCSLVFLNSRIDRADAAIMARFLSNKVRAGEQKPKKVNENG